MPTRKLKITKLDEKTRGTGKYGDWIMHEVTAENEDGSPIKEKLVTFKDLPLNELIEVEVERKDHETYGTSYTIKPFNPNSPPSREEFKLLAERVSDLEDAVQGHQSAPEPDKPPETTPGTSDDIKPEDSESDLDSLPF